MKDIAELTEQDFSRAISRKQRKRLMEGRFETGDDIVALRTFVALSQTRFAEALGISVPTQRSASVAGISPADLAPSHAFRQLIDNLQGLRVLDATQEHHAAVVRMFDRFRGTKLTYTDASSVVHLAERKIKRVWSTHPHLAVSGVEVLPRSGSRTVE
jgi:hypothetical protein